MITFMPSARLLDSPRGRHLPPHDVDAAMTARTDRLPEAAGVVLVGGGLAAVTLAATLWHAGIPDIVILEQSGELCRRFFDRVDVLHQRVLRSPYDHHPGVEGYRDCELLDFARLHWASLTDVERREVRMAQAGHRSVVPLDVFEAFCRHVVSVHGLAGRTWRARASQVVPTDTEVLVRTDVGDVVASSAVLCLGERRATAPDRWWEGTAPPDRVQYWDEPLPESLPEPGGQLVVVGAGLSAAHLVASALAAGGRVHWVFRESQERYQCADVNASFFRVEGRLRFDRTSWQDRLGMIGSERRASVMFEFRPQLAAAEADGRLVVHRGSAISRVCAVRGGAVVELVNGASVAGDRVVLALGTTPSVGTDLLPAEVVGLHDGWPDLDEATLAYRAAHRVHALGAATCMVLGPAGRNIDGHRVAASRVTAAIMARSAVLATGTRDLSTRR